MYNDRLKKKKKTLNVGKCPLTETTDYTDLSICIILAKAYLLNSTFNTDSKLTELTDTGKHKSKNQQFIKKKMYTIIKKSFNVSVYKT